MSIAGYSPWGCTELDMTEWLIHSTHTHRHTHTHTWVNYQFCHLSPLGKYCYLTKRWFPHLENRYNNITIVFFIKIKCKIKDIKKSHSVLVLVSQSRLTLCDPIFCSLPGSSVYGILQARILEWVAISLSTWLYNMHQNLKYTFSLTSKSQFL